MQRMQPRARALNQLSFVESTRCVHVLEDTSIACCVHVLEDTSIASECNDNALPFEATYSFRS